MKLFLDYMRCVQTMSRVFTTFFIYHRKEYTAVITQVRDSVSIYLPDESLHDIIPDGKINFDCKTGFELDGARGRALTNLIMAVFSAIDQKTYK